MPHVLHWICIRQFWGSVPLVDMISLQEALSTFGDMFGVIVLHEPMRLRKDIFKEGDKGLLKDLAIEDSIPGSLEYTDSSPPFATDASPNMKFDWMFGPMH